MRIFNPFKWLDEKLTVKFPVKPPVFRHILRSGWGGGELVVQEYITSVEIEGVIYYEDLRKVANMLIHIANLDRTGEGY